MPDFISIIWIPPVSWRTSPGEARLKECHVFLDHENLYAIPRYLATAVNKLHSNHADNCGGVAAPKTSKHQISFPSRTYNLIGIKCYLFVFEPIKLKTANISCENQHFQHKNQPTYASIRFRNQLVEQLLKITCHIVGKGQAALSLHCKKRASCTVIHTIEERN